MIEQETFEIINKICYGKGMSSKNASCHGTKKDSKQISEERKHLIIDMKCADMRAIDIGNFYNMPQPTVCNIIRVCKLRTKNHLKRKRGPKFRLSERAFRILKKM